jgi:hypothetical protein
VFNATLARQFAVDDALTLQNVALAAEGRRARPSVASASHHRISVHSVVHHPPTRSGTPPHAVGHPGSSSVSTSFVEPRRSLLQSPGPATPQQSPPWQPRAGERGFFRVDVVLFMSTLVHSELVGGLAVDAQPPPASLAGELRAWVESWADLARFVAPLTRADALRAFLNEPSPSLLLGTAAIAAAATMSPWPAVSAGLGAFSLLFSCHFMVNNDGLFASNPEQRRVAWVCR